MSRHCFSHSSSRTAGILMGLVLMTGTSAVSAQTNKLRVGPAHSGLQSNSPLATLINRLANRVGGPVAAPVNPSGWGASPGAPAPATSDAPPSGRVPVMADPKLGYLNPEGEAEPWIEAPQLGFYGQVRPGWGIMVLDVIPGSLAERTGLECGDVIMRADGRRITSHASLRQALIHAERYHGGAIQLLVDNVRARHGGWGRRFVTVEVHLLDECPHDGAPVVLHRDTSAIF